MTLEAKETKIIPRKVTQILLKPLIPSSKKQWIATKSWSIKLTKTKIKLFK